MKTPEEMKQERQERERQEQERLEQERHEREIKFLLNRIREFIGDRNYIFRGENKENKRISSKLYRYFEIIEGQVKFQETAPTRNFKLIEEILKKDLGELEKKINFVAIEKILKENILTQLAKQQEEDYSFDLKGIQKDLILSDVKEYVDFENETDILAELQHYGGSTNLIDFSYDLAVALFFACDGEPEEDGRLILLRIDAKTKDVIPLKKNQNNRIVFQKSALVKRDKGYIDEEKEEIKKFTISKNIKSPLLTYVQNYFGVRTETVYEDLIGYIQNQERHSEAYKQFFAGTIHYQKEEFGEAIDCFTTAIELKPNFADAYNSRGRVKVDKKPSDLDGAMKDYNRAIDINPKHAGAHTNRSILELLLAAELQGDNPLVTFIRKEISKLPTPLMGEGKSEK